MIVSVSAVVVVPSFSITFIVRETDVPTISPSSSNFCIDGKPIVILTALTEVLLIVCVTGEDAVTLVPTGFSVSIAAIPGI